MVNSDHLAGLSPDARRCAVLMAFTTRSALRSRTCCRMLSSAKRALADYEKLQQDKLRRFEQAKAEENRRILQGELER